MNNESTAAQVMKHFSKMQMRKPYTGGAVWHKPLHYHTATTGPKGFAFRLARAHRLTEKGASTQLALKLAFSSPKQVMKAEQLLAECKWDFAKALEVL